MSTKCQHKTDSEQSGGIATIGGNYSFESHVRIVNKKPKRAASHSKNKQAKTSKDKTFKASTPSRIVFRIRDTT